MKTAMDPMTDIAMMHAIMSSSRRGTDRGRSRSWSWSRSLGRGRSRATILSCECRNCKKNEGRSREPCDKAFHDVLLSWPKPSRNPSL
jgi:hypothetical protein